ncbi:RHS repeat-associated core domain-containing protein [Microbulbifer sp. VAAF005]|uniref:RHS repeat-associated core domain-containing protein n=1 Tax=Microbulbifer sp. VAAF005 TaxID=3034230 RepID=UPI0024ACDC1C|nr:RHS repeat-associated core domain-containing protein [Microbulbifer sp. VAAF005]WHI47267.1 RHS repeat-associated core domain-containing protein [Microbulbifer sp. VAAF005]
MLNSGQERHKETDMVVNGSYPIQIIRKYNNQSDYDSALGYGWAFDHDYRLYEYPDDKVIIRYCAGHRAEFVYSGGAYVSDVAGLRGTLSEDSDGTYTFAHNNGRKDYYDAEGRLTARESKTGQRLEFTYSSERFPIVGTSLYSVDPSKPMTVAYSYQLQKIEERLADGSLSGNYVSFSYDSDTGRVTQAVDHTGRTVVYSHDTLDDSEGNTLTSGNLIKVTGLEGLVSTYKYEDSNDSHNLTYFQVGENATPYEETYDSEDRVIKEVYGNLIFEFDYVTEGYETEVTTTITDADGNNPYTTTERYVFNEDGRTVEYEDQAGYLTVKTRDANNNVTREERYGLADDNGDRTLARAIDYTYNTDNRRLSKAVNLASGEIITTSWTYEGGWIASEEIVSSADATTVFRTEYTFNYDSDGNPQTLASIKKLKADGSYQTTSYSYNARNQLTATIYADGSQYVLEYENESLYPTKEYWKDQNGNALTTGEKTYTYDQAGNRLTITDAIGNITTYAYDDINRPVQVTNALNEETHYTYADNNLVQVEIGRSTDSTTEEVIAGQITLINYDGKDRIISIERQGSDGTKTTYQSYTYDSLGRRLRTSDALGNATTFTYDMVGNLASTTDPEGSEISYSYDAFNNVVSTTDPLNRVVIYTYDALGRLTESEHQGVSPSLVTSYSYDASGNLLTITDPENNTTTYTYDRLGRKIGEVHPGGETAIFSYDDRDRLSSKTGARGQVLEYSYESWGGLVSIEHFASATDHASNNTERSQSFAYNDNGQLTQAIDTAIQSNALYTNSYDALNRLSQTSNHYIPGGDRTLSYTYNTQGDLNGLSLDNTIETGGVLTNHSFGYDDYARLISATLAGSTHTLGYDSADHWTSLTYASGARRTNIYNVDGTLTSTTLEDPSGTILEALSYSFDAANKIISYSDNDGVQSFTYDGVDRLTSADYPDSIAFADETFSYDGVGNREDPSDNTVYEYNSSNQLISQNNEALIRSYDSDGNLTSITGTENKTFTYDLDNRLTGYTDGTTIASYGYGVSGRRLYKTVDGITTWFLWNGTQLIAEFEETSGTASLIQRYDYLPGSYAPIQVVDTKGSYTVYSDHLDTPRLLINSDGEAIWRSTRSVFGEAVIDGDVDGDGYIVTFNIRFPGQYYDGESGLSYNYFRNYDPALGRYIQGDPLGLYGGLNIFTYANQNPVMLIDPNGLKASGVWMEHPHLDQSTINVSYSGWEYTSGFDHYLTLLLIRLNFDVSGAIVASVKCSDECGKEWEKSYNKRHSEEENIDLGINIPASLVGLRFGPGVGLLINAIVIDLKINESMAGFGDKLEVKAGLIKAYGADYICEYGWPTINQ